MASTSASHITFATACVMDRSAAMGGHLLGDVLGVVRAGRRDGLATLEWVQDVLPSDVLAAVGAAIGDGARELHHGLRRDPDVRHQSSGTGRVPGLGVRDSLTEAI